MLLQAPVLYELQLKFLELPIMIVPSRIFDILAIKIFRMARLSANLLQVRP